MNIESVAEVAPERGAENVNVLANSYSLVSRVVEYTLGDALGSVPEVDLDDYIQVSLNADIQDAMNRTSRSDKGA